MLCFGDKRKKTLRRNETFELNDSAAKSSSILNGSALEYGTQSCQELVEKMSKTLSSGTCSAIITVKVSRLFMSTTTLSHM